MTGIHSLVCGEDLRDPFLAAPELVAQRHHTIGGVVSEIFHHTVALFNEIGLFGFVVSFLSGSCHSTPEWKLWLHIDTHQISSSKCGIRRTAGMETVMVDAVAFGDGQYLDPFLDGGRNGTGQWEDQTVMLAPQKCLAAVDQKIMSLGSKIAESKGGSDGFCTVREENCQFIDHRCIFAPEYRVVS